jgi:hypothetical protein
MREELCILVIDSTEEQEGEERPYINFGEHSLKLEHEQQSLRLYSDIFFEKCSAQWILPQDSGIVTHRRAAFGVLKQGTRR